MEPPATEEAVARELPRIARAVLLAVVPSANVGLMPVTPGVLRSKVTVAAGAQTCF